MSAAGQTWRVAVAAPAAKVAAFEAALEPFAIALSIFEAETALDRPRNLPEPATWAGDLWLADACVVEAILDEVPTTIKGEALQRA